MSEASARAALFDPARHEPLCSSAWDPGVAQRGIQQIVDATLAQFDDQALWPTHPRDTDLGDAGRPAAALYHGAAGVIWALQHLRERGHARFEVEFGATVVGLLEHNRRFNAASHIDEHSYVLGDPGVLLLQFKLLARVLMSGLSLGLALRQLIFTRVQRPGATIQIDLALPQSGLAFGVPVGLRGTVDNVDGDALRVAAGLCREQTPRQPLPDRPNRVAARTLVLLVLQLEPPLGVDVTLLAIAKLQLHPAAPAGRKAQVDGQFDKLSRHNPVAVKPQTDQLLGLGRQSGQAEHEPG